MYNHSNMGACNNPGYGYPPPYPSYPGQFAMPSMARMEIVGQSPYGMSMIGQPAPPPAQKSWTDQIMDWGGQKTFGIQNGWLLGAAAATGLVWGLWGAGVLGDPGYDLDY